MSNAFNDFIETELPLRPSVAVDGAPGQILVRSPNANHPREMVWADNSGGNDVLTGSDPINGEIVTLYLGCPVAIDTASPGSVVRAIGNDPNLCIVIGLIAAESVAPGDTSLIKATGSIIADAGEWSLITGSGGGLTPGANYFLHTGTPGRLITTFPTTTNSGYYVTKVGTALSTTELIIAIDPPVQI